MKKIISIGLLSLMFMSCNNKPNPKTHYINENFVIVDKGGYAERNGKYTHVGKFFLIKRLKDTIDYTELNSRNFRLTDSMYYNNNVGDTLYFNYIKRDRFWKKK